MRAALLLSKPCLSTHSRARYYPIKILFSGLRHVRLSNGGDAVRLHSVDRRGRTITPGSYLPVDTVVVK
jgi:hypothetical protein